MSSMSARSPVPGPLAPNPPAPGTGPPAPGPARQRDRPRVTPRRPKRPPQPKQPSGSLFTGAPGWLPTALIAVLGAAGLALFFGTVGQATPKLNDMSALGLISIMPHASLAGLVLLALAFVLALGRARPKPLLLGALVAGIVIALDGVTTVMEPEPRFPTAYWIAGFVEYIYRTGHTSPALSAYFSWPGFFEIVVVIEHLFGSDNLMPVLRYWPVAMDLLALVPMGLIVKRLHATWRDKWLALFIFTVGNWVGPDYFSPQSFLSRFLLAVSIASSDIRSTADAAESGPGSGGAGHRVASRRFVPHVPVPAIAQRLLDRVKPDRPLPR